MQLKVYDKNCFLPLFIKRYLLLGLVVLPLLSLTAQKPKLDRIIHEITQRNLNKNHPSGPEIKSISTFDDRFGHHCRAVVSVRSNRAKSDLILVYAALAQAVVSTKTEFEQLIVMVVYDQHYYMPEVWVSDYEATVECFVYNKIDLATWLGKHLYHKEL